VPKVLLILGIAIIGIGWWDIGWWAIASIALVWSAKKVWYSSHAPLKLSYPL
jgi:hypothetical protein